MKWYFEIPAHIPGSWWLTFLEGKYDVRVEDAKGRRLINSSFGVKVAKRLDLPLDPRLEYPVRILVSGDAVGAPIVHHGMEMYEMEEA